MIQCLVDFNMTTALVAEPLRQGWVDGSGIELVAALNAEEVAKRSACALLGSIDAALLADRYTVVTDVGLASWHAGAVALWSPVRPDELDDIPVELAGISRTAEAIARATVARYFGMKVSGWNRDGQDGQAVVREHQDALLETSSGVLTDLVRAWFVLSGLPVITHTLVVPNELLQEQPDAVATLVETIADAARTGVKRRREIRRNLHDQFPVDRDQLVTFHNEQTLTLSKTARKGWLDLVRRVGWQMALPRPETITFVTLSAHENESGEG